MEFDREKHLKDLLGSVGLHDVPEADLHLYKIQINSPTGKGNMFISAKEYVDRELSNIEESIVEFKKHNLENSIEPELPVVQLQQLEVPKLPELALDGFRYFDMNVEGQAFTVIIYEDLSENANPIVQQQILDQINLLKGHWSFVRERSRNLLTGMEHIVSYYQFANHASKFTAKKTDDYLSYEDIGARMDKVLDGFATLDGFK